MSAAFLNKRFEHKEKIVNRENCELKAKKADADEPPHLPFYFAHNARESSGACPRRLTFGGAPHAAPPFRRPIRRGFFPWHCSARRDYKKAEQIFNSFGFAFLNFSQPSADFSGSFQFLHRSECSRSFRRH